ncbi:MAG: GNAT family N-acetyltransferase [Leptolyngbya sp. SIO4C1]|nr:GNAT family N-acetyltransferase [Leptolyngbya sp. SIO4C1]
MTDLVEISPATPADVPILFDLVKALADYEKLSHEVTGTPAALHQHLFGDRTYAEAIMARVNQTPAGFAIYFYNFSTFLMKPGLYLEDLFVLPDYRRQGVGTAIFQHLARHALAQGCGRFEWSVLDWNEPAIQFYQQKGAALLPDWRTCRVTGEALVALAQG